MNINQQYIETEQRLINLMLKDASVVDELLNSGITTNHFDPKHRHLVQSIFYVFGISNGKRILSEEHYRSILIEGGSKGNLSVAMDLYFQCLVGVHYTNSKDDLDLLKKKFIEAYVHRQGVICLTKFNENVNKLGYVAATKQYIEDLEQSVNLIETQKSAFFTVDEVLDKYTKSIENKKDHQEQKVICYIPEIDDAMNVGFKAGHTSLFVAPTGTHKTNIMLNITLNIFLKQKCHVLFIPLEMDWEDFIHRIVSNLTGIPYKTLLSPYNLLTEEQLNLIKKAEIWIKNDFKFGVIDVDEQISISYLKREIEKRISYFQPRIVVVDYLGLLKLDTKYSQRHDLQLGSLTKTLKFLGKKYGFHIITAAQMGRSEIRRIREQGVDATPDSTAVKDSQDVASDTEFIFALTTVQDEENRLKLHVIKSRYGKSGFTTELVLDASTCRIMSTKKELENQICKNDSWVSETHEWETQTPENAKKELEEIDKGQNLNFQSMDLELLNTI